MYLKKIMKIEKFGQCLSSRRWSKDRCNFFSLSTRHLAARINEIGVQMIEENLRKYLFYGREFDNKSDEQVIIGKVRKHLKKFNLATDEHLASSTGRPMKDIDGRLELPKLSGDNIDEHIRNIARKQTDVYARLMSVFSMQNIPEIPREFCFKPGWTRLKLKLYFKDHECFVLRSPPTFS